MISNGRLHQYASYGLIFVAVGLWVFWWRTTSTTPVMPVDLIDASLEETSVPEGGDLDVLFVFRKNRDDCNHGRLTRYVWNEKGEWIKVAYNEMARQAPASDHPQPIRVSVPMIDSETGRPVPPGTWALNTIVSYDCPFKGGVVILDDTVNTTTFEVVAVGD